MSLKWKVGIPLLPIVTIIVTTLVCGCIETQKFSAYGVCRAAALNTKGYAVWKHERTFPLVFASWVVFSDGFNDLSCQAIGIGPFWTVRNSIHTLVGCGKSLGDEQVSMCPEEYFGVNP
jgi:hypothetical protein